MGPRSGHCEGRNDSTMGSSTCKFERSLRRTLSILESHLFSDAAMLEFGFDTTARALPEQTTVASDHTMSGTYT